MTDFIKDREKLIDDQIDAARNIKHNFGSEKAIGYIVGEKLFQLLEDLDCNRPPGKHNTEAIRDLDLLISKMSTKIVEMFDAAELRNYFAANPRFGALGHVLTEDEHQLFVENDVAKHTLHSEIKDALIMGEMKRYLNL